MLSTVPDLKADIVPVGYRHVAALLAMTNVRQTLCPLGIATSLRSSR